MVDTNLATGRAAQLATQLLDDLRGSGYFADPKILSGFIRTGDRVTPQDEHNAQELIRLVLQMYAKGESQDQVKEGVSATLKGFGIR
jgi:translation elongation factor EF-G